MCINEVERPNYPMIHIFVTSCVPVWPRLVDYFEGVDRMCVLFSGLQLDSLWADSRLFLRSKAPRRDCLSANLRPVTAFLLHTEAGKSLTRSIGGLDDGNFTEKNPADGFVSGRGDLETRARSRSREEAPTSTCSEAENSTDDRPACQLEGRLTTGTEHTDWHSRRTVETRLGGLASIRLVHQEDLSVSHTFNWDLLVNERLLAR